MKVITDPTITVVAGTQFFEHPVYKIPSDGTDAEKLGAFAAKGCYDSYGDSGRSNVENQRAVIESLHGSVLEHSGVSFFIEGITRGCSLELNRHRHFAISQRSTRYTKEEDSCIVLEPYFAELFKKYNFEQRDNGMWKYQPASQNLHNEDEVELIFGHLVSADTAFHEYEEEVNLLVKLNPNKLTGFDLRKWARGKARNILPHGLETRGTWSASHREIRWFIELRSEEHAEPEIRRLAVSMFNVVKNIAPTFYEDFEITKVVDGIPQLTPKYHKV